MIEESHDTLRQQCADYFLLSDDAFLARWHYARPEPALFQTFVALVSTQLLVRGQNGAPHVTTTIRQLAHGVSHGAVDLLRQPLADSEKVPAFYKQEDGQYIKYLSMLTLSTATYAALLGVPVSDEYDLAQRRVPPWLFPFEVRHVQATSIFEVSPEATRKLTNEVTIIFLDGPVCHEAHAPWPFNTLEELEVYAETYTRAEEHARVRGTYRYYTPAERKARYR